MECSGDVPSMNLKVAALNLILLAGIACGAEIADTRTGRVLLSQLQCSACHAPSTEQSAWIRGASALDLREIGKRVNPDWLQRFIAAPAEVAPQTSMPDMLHGIPADERANVADALTHFLISQSVSAYRPLQPDRAAVQRGEDLYHRIGCVACHGAMKEADSLKRSSNLQGMSAKWSHEGLRRYLINPLALRPLGRMPAMNLSDSEASDLAHYLLRETQVPGVLEAALYRGKMRTLDDIESADLVRTALVDSIVLDLAGRDRGFAMRFTGFLNIENAGDFTFYLTSEGPSRLSLDEKVAVGDAGDRERKAFSANGTVHLERGWHAIALDYLQRGQNTSLKLEWQGAGIPRAPVPAALLRTTREPIPQRAPFVVDSAKAAKGRAYFSERRCDACHSTPGKPEAQTAPGIAALHAGRGCLAEQPGEKLPKNRLEPAQRESLAAALAELNRVNLSAPSAKEQLSDTMLAMNCYACHSRDRMGGATADANVFFTANVEDVGDEGRLPPKLDGVGNKLKPAWLDKVLTRGGAVRPHFNTRMPQFGAANVGQLAAQFVEVDRKAQPLANVPDSPDEQRAAGLKLAGTDGVSCIACHKFNRMPAHALQMIDLTTAAERLNEDWFRPFMRDPNRFHPGTRMPSFWPDGESVLKTELKGDPERQIAALWTFFADGPRAKFPAGLSRQSMELVVGGDPVVYRGKLWEAGFRAFAAGYPEGVNVAFDAEELRLALLWRGKFLDASPHWSSQGMGQIHPRGTDVVILPHGPALAVLADSSAPWPSAAGRSAGMKFGGYSIDAAKRPTLLYAFNGVSVEDFFIGSDANGKQAVRRTLNFSGESNGPLYLRLAAGLIAPSAEKSWRFDNKVTLRVARGEAVLRGEGESRELLVPVRFEGGRCRVEIDYEW
jgi:mono/diheme cytochrome c family protein